MAKRTLQSVAGKACFKKHGPEFYRKISLMRKNIRKPGSKK